MRTFMNGAMLAVLALAVSAVKLSQEEGEAMVGTSVSITPEEALEINAELAKATIDVIAMDGVEEPDFAGNFSEDSEPEDCGCECPEACPYDNMVALPKDLYKDAKAEYAAKIAAEKLKPLVVDLALPWNDILSMDPEELDSQILLPMFEEALEQQMKENPELASALPNKPNHLQEQVDMVLEAIKGMDGVGLGFGKVDEAAEGVERHTLVSGTGWISSASEWEDVQLFTKITPGVFFFSSENNAEANNAFEPKWRNLQRSTFGAAYYRVDVDNHPEIAAAFGVTSTPYFVARYGEEDFARTSGHDNGEWVHFKGELARKLKDFEVKDTWNPENHEGEVTKKETRRTDSQNFTLGDHQKKIDAGRIVDDGTFEGFGYDEKDGEYSLARRA